MARPSLLVVEDDLQVLQGLVSGLSRAGFDVTVAVDGADAMRLALQPFDAVVLDLMLVDCTGFDVLAAVRGRVSTPVIVLSARTELHSRLKSFELGAVDFVPKPFWMEELVVRLRARLALREAAPARTLDVGAVVLDLDRRRSPATAPTSASPASSSTSSRGSPSARAAPSAAATSRSTRSATTPT